MGQKVAFTVMRVGLGVVFLLFGIGKFQDDIWAQTIKGMDLFQKLPWSVNVSVILIGVSETATGCALIAGLFTRFFAAVAAAQLLGISILLKFEEIRDIGLLGAALYMAIASGEAFGVEGLWKKGKGGAS